LYGGFDQNVNFDTFPSEKELTLSESSKTEGLAEFPRSVQRWRKLLQPTQRSYRAPVEGCGLGLELDIEKNAPRLVISLGCEELKFLDRANLASHYFETAKVQTTGHNGLIPRLGNWSIILQQ